MGESNNQYPFGIIPKVEIQVTHIDFLRGNNSINWIMIDITFAENLVNRGKTAISYFGKINPNIKVITTTTIRDNKLLKYHREHETEIIKRFRPNYHVPCDCPVYIGGKESIRFEIVKNYSWDLPILKKEIEKYGINIIPLFKAANDQERKICYDLFKELGVDYISYYAAQYGGKGRGMRINQLNEDIRQIISETGIKKVMIIGTQSYRVLKKLPPQVIAAAGQRWIKKSKLRKLSIEKAQRKYSKWKSKVENKTFGKGDDVLGNY